jgi:hypothetical protein
MLMVWLLFHYTYSAAADSYEDHFVLPKDKVLLVTNRRVMLLSAPGMLGTAS